MMRNIRRVQCISISMMSESCGKSKPQRKQQSKATLVGLCTSILVSKILIIILCSYQNGKITINEALVPDLRRNHWRNATCRTGANLALFIINRHSINHRKIIGGPGSLPPPPAPLSLCYLIMLNMDEYSS